MARESRDGLIFCLIGPAGSGKTTFSEKLLSDFAGTLARSVSVTSRSPRQHEREGVSYYFVTREDFQERIGRGEFFEWEENHGNLYGTLKDTLESAIAEGRDLILDIDIRGALSFKRAYPHHTVIVFLIPPSPETLTERLRGRGAIDPEELHTRLSTAKEEYRLLVEDRSQDHIVDYAVVNSDLSETYSVVKSILVAERSRLERFDLQKLQYLCTVG